MNILLVNPPYISLTSAHGVGHQVPLGLLCIGGPLLDSGHTVRLLDAERHRLTGAALVDAIAQAQPDIVMTGHAGSTPAHPACLQVMAAAKVACPDVVTVYGGPYPTYHADNILAGHPEVDVIVRGEGEAVARSLVTALAAGADLTGVAGIAFRCSGTTVTSPAALSIADLNAWRVGWELVDDWDLYQCFGLGRAAIVQFSRGCPHSCSYCGQYQFWTRWRFRDPVRVAAEIAWLHRTHGVMFVDLADENPTSSKRMWRALLEALVAEGVPVKLFATIRATDIVRDADLLPLARQAGLICVLMGIETTDPATLAAIRKGSTVKEDQKAVALLRQAGILSMLGHIVGFEEERPRDTLRATRQVMAYDPDLLNAMYVTPHRWSDWTAANGARQVIQEDVARWDYRHQLLQTRHMAPWQVFAAVKLMELAVHLRPRALWRVLAHPDRGLRRHLRWCFRNSARVLLAEVAEFIWHTRRPIRPMTLAQWFAPPTIPAPRSSRTDLPAPRGLTDGPVHAEVPSR